MAGIKDYSTTPASNDGLGIFDENQNPSTVNNGGRQVMADIRSWYESLEYRDLGHTPTQTSATTFTIVGDQTATYTTNRAIQCTDSSTLYGYVVSSSFGAVTTVTVVLNSGSLSASLSAVAIGLDPTNSGIPKQTTAQMNTLLSDDDFATLAGTETLTNKTINLANNTVTCTAAELNAAISDDDFVGANDVVTLTNKTISAGTFTGSGTLTGTMTVTESGASTVLNGGADASSNTITRCGSLAGQNATGTDNTGVGRQALQTITTGVESTAVGSAALQNDTGGTNTAVGYQAGNNLSTGTNNTFLGHGTGGALVMTGANNSLIGHAAAPTSAGVSNEFTLGDSSVATLRCQQTTITALSDERDKDNIQDLNLGLQFINSLRPVSFKWNMRDGGQVGNKDFGFIAQELQQVQEDEGHVPGLVYDSNPERLEASYGKLLPILIKAVQQLTARVEELENGHEQS